MKSFKKIGVLAAVCGAVAIVGTELIYSKFVVGGAEAPQILERIVKTPEVEAYFGKIADITMSKQGTKWESGTRGRRGVYNYRVQGSKMTGTIMVKWEQKPQSDIVIMEIRRAYMEGGDFIWRMK